MSDVHPSSPMGEPVTAGRPATPAMTPGQAAYEAAMLAIARQAAEGIDAAQIAIMITWDEQTETVRAAWHDAGQAAITAGTGKILAELTTARRERDQLQAAHNAVAAKNAELAADLEALRGIFGETREWLEHGDSTRAHHLIADTLDGVPREVTDAVWRATGGEG